MPWQPLCPARAGAERVPVSVSFCQRAPKWLCLFTLWWDAAAGRKKLQVWVAQCWAQCPFQAVVCAGCSCIPACE